MKLFCTPKCAQKVYLSIHPSGVGGDSNITEYTALVNCQLVKIYENSTPVGEPRP